MSAPSDKPMLHGMHRHCYPANSAHRAGRCCNSCNECVGTDSGWSRDFARPYWHWWSKSPSSPSSSLPVRRAATDCRTPDRRWQSRQRKSEERMAWAQIISIEVFVLFPVLNASRMWRPPGNIRTVLRKIRTDVRKIVPDGRCLMPMARTAAFSGMLQNCLRKLIVGRR